MPVRPELLAAATWRAAQSGLEDNLVALPTATPVPAHQLIRRLLAELRPTLETAGDWELVAQLARSTLARPGSAARQRAAWARGGPQEVVDTLMEETCAGGDWQLSAGATRAAVSALP
jgi:carboxylate-amine ligase